MTAEPVPAIQTDNILRAVLMGLSAYFCFAVMNVCAKTLSETHSVIEVAFYRNAISLLPVVLWLFATGHLEKLKMKRPGLTILRSAIGSVSLMVTFAAYAHLPMADATVLLMAAVLITPVFAVLILKEKVGVHRWSAIILGLLGVALMAGPTGQISALGTFFAVAAAIMHAMMAIILRLMRDQPAITTTFYFMLLGAVIPSVLMPFVAQPLTQTDLFYVLLCGTAGAAAQLFLSNAYRLAPTYMIMPLNYTGLIWATGFDIVIWRHIPGWPVYAGAAVIFAANSYILYREQLRKRKV